MKTLNRVFFFAICLFLQTSMLLANSPQGEGKGQLLSNGAKVVSVYQEGLAITELNGRYGFVNRQGYEMVRPRYDQVRLFVNGYASVAVEGRWTFINKQGQRLFAPRYDQVGSFSADGVAPVRKDGKWGFINEQGQEFIKPQFERVNIFFEGKALVKYQGEWFYVNQRGDMELALQAVPEQDQAAFDWAQF